MSEPRQHGTEGERCRYIEGLVGRTDGEAFTLLLEAAHDESWRVRERSIRLLTQFPAEQLVQAVRETVTGNRDPSLRHAAMDALVRQGSAAVEPIVAMLTEDMWELRLHAAVMLGNIKSISAVPALGSLLTDPEENVIHAAAESLGSIGDPSAVEPLLKVLREQEFWTQYPAVIALGRLGHASATVELLGFLDDEMLAPAVVDALGKIADPRALQPLIGILTGGDSIVPPNQVLRALARIVEIGGEGAAEIRAVVAPVRHAIVETLASEELDDRVAALLIAGWTRDVELIPHLVPHLSQDAEQEAAYAALEAMGEAAGPVAIDLLESPQSSLRRLGVRLLGGLDSGMEIALRHIIDPDEMVRVEIALAIAKRGDTGLSEYLLEMLLDENDEVRRVALEVLASFGADDAVREQLYRRLEYYPDDHLPTMIETLGRLRVGDALSRLQPLMAPPHGEDVRAAAVGAISEIGGDAACEMLLRAASDDAAEVRVQALNALASYPTDAVFETLSHAASGPDSHCAYAGIRALGRLADPRAGTLLENVALDASAELGLRVAAVGALGHLEAEESVGSLLNLLEMEDPDVRREVVLALDHMRGARAFEGLVRATGDSFWGVRATAIRALSKRGDAGFPIVLKALDDEEPLVCKAAIRGAFHAGPAVAKHLYPLLGDDELEEVVAETLMRLGSEVVHQIAAWVRESPPTVRIRVARLMGQMGGHAAEDVLRDLSADEVPEVAVVARKALARGGDV